jgi:hypothetical protein
MLATNRRVSSHRQEKEKDRYQALKVENSVLGFFLSHTDSCAWHVENDVCCEKARMLMTTLMEFMSTQPLTSQGYLPRSCKELCPEEFFYWLQIFRESNPDGQ